MDFTHDEHEGRTVKLAYCLNLHAAADLSATLAGIESVTLPLRERIAGAGRFGVGLYLPADVARGLASGRGRADLDRLTRFLCDQRLDPFTYNAFPHSRFHDAVVKEAVFEPTWREPERLEFTLAVARTAAHLVRACGGGALGDHVSISTHSGMFGAHVRSRADLDECCIQMARAVLEFECIEEETGVRIVLALEPEPRASVQSSEELVRFLERARELGAKVLEDEGHRDAARAERAMHRHLGHCLDACHAAVEGETAPLRDLTKGGHVLGKLQYSNALVVEKPAENPAGLAALLALDEPRYLHQVTGHGAKAERATDLSELRGLLATEARERWLACDRLVCHFHVPVDLASAGLGLTTTRSYADALLGAVLLDPTRWTTRDLHLEIETYTWDVLPGNVRGEGELVDGLEREYRHVLGVLARAGWHPAR